MNKVFIKESEDDIDIRFESPEGETLRALNYSNIAKHFKTPVHRCCDTNLHRHSDERFACLKEGCREIELEYPSSNCYLPNEDHNIVLIIEKKAAEKKDATADLLFIKNPLLDNEDEDSEEVSFNMQINKIDSECSWSNVKNLDETPDKSVCSYKRRKRRTVGFINSPPIKITPVADDRTKEIIVLPV